MVFLMTGPATNAASFITIWKVLGTKTALIYLISVAACALATGLFLDYIALGVKTELAPHAHQMIPPIFNHICAVILLSTLILGIIKSRTKTAKPD